MKFKETIDHGNGITENHCHNGDIIWFKNGKTHRDGEPAFIGANGVKKWCQNGLLHNENGHAYEDGSAKVWCMYGEMHREDGPAVISENGKLQWARNGKLHREDGPAVINENGKKSWWINGEELSEQEFNAFRLQKELNCNEVKEKKLKI